MNDPKYDPVEEAVDAAHVPPMTLRILAVDDEPDILEIYRETLAGPMPGAGASLLEELQSRLFGTDPAASSPMTFEVEVCGQGDEAVQVVQRALDEGRPFAVAFLDVRMPPGPDGVWTARQIRAIDPNVEILIVTAFSDVHPMEISRLVPPADKLFYVQKPFHPQEIQQFSLALGAKWRAERLLEEVNRELERKVRERTAELEMANERLARLAITDDLTGLHNRRRLVEVLEAEFSRAYRYEKSMAVLMIDLDHFKRVNDEYGHQTGDQALQWIAGILKENTRRSDMVARFGGEEFAIVLIETGPGQAMLAAENLRRTVDQAEFLIDETRLHITISIGVAVFPDVKKSPNHLLEAADKALYQAKNEGRNRVLLYDQSMDK